MEQFVWKTDTEIFCKVWQHNPILVKIGQKQKHFKKKSEYIYDYLGYGRYQFLCGYLLPRPPQLLLLPLILW